MPASRPLTLALVLLAAPNLASAGPRANAPAPAPAPTAAPAAADPPARPRASRPAPVPATSKTPARAPHAGLEDRPSPAPKAGPKDRPAAAPADAADRPARAPGPKDSPSPTPAVAGRTAKPAPKDSPSPAKPAERETGRSSKPAPKDSPSPARPAETGTGPAQPAPDDSPAKPSPGLRPKPAPDADPAPARPAGPAPAPDPKDSPAPARPAKPAPKDSPVQDPAASAKPALKDTPARPAGKPALKDSPEPARPAGKPALKDSPEPTRPAPDVRAPRDRAAPARAAARPPRLRPRGEPLLASHPAASCAADPLEAVGLSQHQRTRGSLREFYWSDMARFFETTFDESEPSPHQVDDPAFTPAADVLATLPSAVRGPLAEISRARVVDRLSGRAWTRTHKLLSTLAPAQVAALLRADSPTLRAHVWTWLSTTRTGGCHLGHVDLGFLEAAVGDRSIAVEHGDDLVFRSLGDYALEARARLAPLDPARFDAFLVRLTGAAEVDPLVRATAHGLLIRRAHWDTLDRGLRDPSASVRAATAAAAAEMNGDKLEARLVEHAAGDPADLVTELIVGALLGVYDPHNHGRPQVRGLLAATRDERLSAAVARWRGRGDSLAPLPVPAHPLRFAGAPVPTSTTTGSDSPVEPVPTSATTGSDSPVDPAPADPTTDPEPAQAPPTRAVRPARAPSTESATRDPSGTHLPGVQDDDERLPDDDAP